LDYHGRPRLVRSKIVSDMEFSIGDAARGNLPEILAIYNEVIRNSTAIYTEEEFAPAAARPGSTARWNRVFR
jgi:hypothetical protein